MHPLKTIKSMKANKNHMTTLVNEPVDKNQNRKKYCRFKKSGIKYIDFKDPNFLLKLVNEQGRILPRRLTGTSQKYQGKVGQAIKRARHLAIMPFVADGLK
jgi:small subunit ribosomal protein S18